MTKLCWILINLLLILYVHKTRASTAAHTRLLRDLFIDYDAGARPAHKEDTIHILLHLELDHIHFILKEGAFNFQGKLDVSWQDRKLHWNPQDYGNLSQIHVPAHTLWVPDLEIYNNAPDKFLRMQYSGMVMVENTGRTLWTETVEMNIFCDANMRSWPNDRHSCKINIGSWTHNGFELDFVKTNLNKTFNFDGTEMLQNSQFKVLNFSLEHVATLYSCCEEPYITVNYLLDIERRASFGAIFQVPGICVILLSLAAFCLEPQRAEKLALNGICLVILTTQLIHFGMHIGSVARNLPLIVIFSSISFVLVTLGTVVSVFSLTASRSKIKSSLPPALRKVLTSRFGTMLDPYKIHALGMENTAMHYQSEEVKLQEYSNLIPTGSCPDEWTRFAVVLERLCFIVFFVIFVILGCSCYT